MKIAGRLIVMFLLMVIPLASTKPAVFHYEEKAAAVNLYVNASFSVFFNTLSPVGVWVSYSNYGYCWVPRLGIDFVPYCTNGHWVYTDYGWTWVSYYDWGWAPFHYGRWAYDDIYGWIWIPGEEWAPAWVVWGSYGGYYGWAPIGPNVTIFAAYRPPIHYWTFVPRERIVGANISAYVVNRSTVVQSNISIINNSMTYSRASFNAGPRASDVAKITGRRIDPVSISESSKPLSGRDVNGINNSVRSPKSLPVYRPTIKRDPHAVPQKVAKLQDIKPINNPASKYSIKSEQPVNHQQNMESKPQRKFERPSIPQNQRKPEHQMTTQHQLNPQQHRMAREYHMKARQEMRTYQQMRPQQ